AAGAAPPEPADGRPPHQPLDAGAGGRGELRPGPDRPARERGDDPRHPEAVGGRVEAGQALAHQPRSGVRPKKRARDRLIRPAAPRPAWALGFEDETRRSRLASPALPAWSEAAQPLRLVERTVAKDDPDPKALACYGLLARRAQPEAAGGWHAEAWLR